MKKRLFILGATGGTGRHLVSQALELGHDVTAFVRAPEKMTPGHDRLRTLRWGGDDSVHVVADAMRGHDVVLSALGAGQSFKSEGRILRSVRTIVPAMARAGVHRLVFTSAFGVLEAHELPFVPRMMQRLLLGDIYADKSAGEELIHASDLEWTLVYPAMLVHGPATGRYRAAEHLALRGLPKISRGDLAAFLLSQVDDQTWVRKGVMIAY